ncbi:MAG TPA: transferrin receptor-like dimerization domain-containing protein, partial [Rhizomicrobium sp.]|nr:transferrin receptor-like dimerization domain-containing protein [Rhizomicrobium sp.]
IVQAGDFADSMARDMADVKKLADKKRKEAETQLAMLRDRSFKLSSDPAETHGVPTPLKPVPKIDFAPLEKAVARLKASAQKCDAAAAARFVQLPPAKRERVHALIDNIDQTLAPEVGLPGRNWYRNLIWAPGRNTGYGVKTLPGIREGIEDERFDDAIRYIGLTADALNAYSARLDEATRVLNGQ